MPTCLNTFVQRETGWRLLVPQSSVYLLREALCHPVVVLGQVGVVGVVWETAFGCHFRST